VSPCRNDTGGEAGEAEMQVDCGVARSISHHANSIFWLIHVPHPTADGSTVVWRSCGGRPRSESRKVGVGRH
jgi:hypothetical protein